jgi:hypothetical protein
MIKSSLGRLGLLTAALLALMSLFAASALAAGAPVVTVEEANEKTLHTVTMHGTVNPNGAATSYKIEYGKTKLYGQSTESKALGAGTSAIAITKLMAGLEPLSTYHYRISATNSFGTTVSSDSQFEMLLAWKVEGKYLSEVANPEWSPTVSFGNETAFANVFKLKGVIFGEVPFEISCEDKFAYIKTNLANNYDFEFKTCKFFAEGKEIAGCKPKPLALHLNAVMQLPLGTKVEFEKGCAMGSSLPLTGPQSGFTVGALSEAEKLPVTLTSVIPYTPSQNLTATISHPAWILTGPWVGMKFGIS